MRRPFDWRGFVARAAVRRVVYIVVGLIIAAAMSWVSPAHAALCGYPSKNEAYTQAGGAITYATQSEAAAACKAAPAFHTTPSGGVIRVMRFQACELAPPTTGGFIARYANSGERIDSNGGCQPMPNSGSTTDSINGWRFTSGCPANAPWDPVTATCKPPKNCAARPNYGGAMVSGASEFCHDGCAYTNAAEVSVCLGEGSAMVCPGASWKPTGAECSSGPAPLPYDTNRDTCERKPGATHFQCVKPSGETCVTSAKGNRFCWRPGESGDRMTADGSEGATKGPGTQQQAPPPSMTDPQPQGTSTTTTTTNNSSTVNATTVFAGSGNTGGQSNVGPGGRDTGTGQGEGEGDGEGNGVSGGGSCAAPPTNCVGDAHTCKLIEQAWLQRCEGQGEADGIANAAGQFNGSINDGDEGPGQGDIDSLLQGDPFEGLKTVEDGGVLVDRLDSSGFLSGGSCPSLESVNVGGITVPLTLGPLCELLSYMSYLVLALAYYLAFKIVAGGA